MGMGYETKIGSQMRLPMQAAPVDRTPGAAALGGAGVEPSIWGALLGAAVPAVIDMLTR
jgi:hypothetical protein